MQAENKQTPEETQSHSLVLKGWQLLPSSWVGNAPLERGLCLLLTVRLL